MIVLAPGFSLISVGVLKGKEWPEMTTTEEYIPALFMKGFVLHGNAEGWLWHGSFHMSAHSRLLQ